MRHDALTPFLFRRTDGQVHGLWRPSRKGEKKWKGSDYKLTSYKAGSEPVKLENQFTASSSNSEMNTRGTKDAPGLPRRACAAHFKLQTLRVRKDCRLPPPRSSRLALRPAWKDWSRVHGAEFENRNNFTFSGQTSPPRAISPSGQTALQCSECEKFRSRRLDSLTLDSFLDFFGLRQSLSLESGLTVINFGIFGYL